MDLPEPPQDALAQPTRAQIFAFLIERRRPTGTGEIARRFDLHPNGVRRHLERLEEGGFVRRRRLREGQGRPRDIWSVSPEAHPGGEPPSAYAELAAWLARSIPATPERLREVEEAGREIGRGLAPPPGEDWVEAFRDTMTALGFQPELERTGGGLACRLENCPYRRAVHEGADVVCTMHRGITAGILAELAPEARLTGFEPNYPPETAGCRVAVSGPPATG